MPPLNEKISFYHPITLSICLNSIDVSLLVSILSLIVLLQTFQMIIPIDPSYIFTLYCHSWLWYSCPKIIFLLPILITRYTKLPLRIFKIFVTAFGSTCDSLLSSKYNTKVHFFPSIILFDTNMLYWLILKPNSLNSDVYILYHRTSDSM